MKTQTEIRRQAARWHTWVDTDEEDEERQREFEDWLVADARHRAAYLAVERAWRHLSVLRQLPAAEQALNDDPVGSPSPVWKRRLLRQDRRRLLAAVAVVVLMAFGIPLWWAQSHAWATYRSAVGQMVPLKLADGTRVTLNTNSAIRVRFGRAQRTVQVVSGEVLFDVAHDSRRPFVVLADYLRVKAVGTRFTVRVYSRDRVDVVMSEGSVELARVWPALDLALLQSPIQGALSEGYSAAVGPQSLSLTKLEAEEVARKLSWLEGVLRFNGQTLSEAIEDMNRYNTWHLQIDDPSISDLKIGGDFPARDPKGFVRALTHIFDVEATFSHTRDSDAGVIHLRKRE